MRLFALAVAILPSATLAGGIVPGGPVYVPPPSVAQDFERWQAPESPDRDGSTAVPDVTPRPSPQPEGPPKEPCPPETNRKNGGGGC